MENNRNECNGGNCQQNGDLPQHLEELLIHERLANFVLKKVDKKLFVHQWKDRLCQIEKTDGRNVLFFLMLNGANEEENKEKLDEILDALKKAEDHFHKCDESERFNVQFKLTHRMLIPEQKCRFIIGTGGETIKKLRVDCNLLKAYIDDKGEKEPLPQGYVRLVMQSESVEGLRRARSDVGAALDYIPRGVWANNGNGNNGKRLSGDGGNVVKMPADLNHETVQKLECAEILVPFPNFRHVLGQNGENHRALQAQFEVRLIFRGENHDEYPNGRWLEIRGKSKENVEEARAHIEANYCMEKDGLNGGNGKREEGNWPKHDKMDNDDEVEELVQKEMTLPELVANKMLKMKIKNELNDFDIRRLRDGNQCVVLKGTRAQVEVAEAKLEKYCEKLAKNGGKWSKLEEESSKSGSEGNGEKSNRWIMPVPDWGNHPKVEVKGMEKPKQCWIMAGDPEEEEDKENDDGPEIVMNDDDEDEEEPKMKKSFGDENPPDIESEFGSIEDEDEELEEKDVEEEDEDEEENEEDEDDENTEEDEEEVEEEEEEMNDEMQEMEEGMGTATSQSMMEMLLAKMEEMKEITEKTFQEMKKEEHKKDKIIGCLKKRIAKLEREKNAHIQVLMKRILSLEDRILAFERQQNGDDE